MELHTNTALSKKKRQTIGRGKLLDAGLTLSWQILQLMRSDMYPGREANQILNARCGSAGGALEQLRANIRTAQQKQNSRKPPKGAIC